MYKKTFKARYFFMKKLLFLGGDKRNITAFYELKSKGFYVDSIGLFTSDTGKIEESEVLVLPVPTTKDKKYLYCPETKAKIPIFEIEKKAEERLIISCGYTFPTKNNVDLLSLDSFAYLNAVPTAEGAISFAIENTDFTLWKAKILVIGFGRVAKVLVDRLNSFGCDLFVSARKQRDFALIDSKNIKYLQTDKTAKNISDFDIVFNTVDVHLFDDLSAFGSTLLIDLSSKGCVNFESEDIKDKRIYKLPAIPAKTAPITSGKILAQTIISLL